MGRHCRRQFSSSGVVFDGSVNIDVCLDHVLKRTVWPTARNIATRRWYWFQKDRASCYVSTFLPRLPQKEIWRSNNLRNTDDHWLPCSPELSSMEFGVWNCVTVNMKKRQSSTIESLKIIVEDVLSGTSEDLARKIALHVSKCSVFRRTEGILNN